MIIQRNNNNQKTIMRGKNNSKSIKFIEDVIRSSKSKKYNNTPRSIDPRGREKNSNQLFFTLTFTLIEVNWLNEHNSFLTQKIVHIEIFLPFYNREDKTIITTTIKMNETSITSVFYLISK